jgi:DNA-binding response OmpR family regulator
MACDTVRPPLPLPFAGPVPAARVLVVEADPALRRLYRQALGEEGYRVEAAASGEEALARLSAGEVPDAMVLEVQLRGMDGITLLRRALDAHPELAVVCNTGCAAFKAHFGAWAADRFVVKSSDLRELKDALAGALGRDDARAKAC